MGTGKYQDKVVLVTGGARGLGRLISMDFAKEGAKIAIADLREGDMKETASAIYALGVEIFTIALEASAPPLVKPAIPKMELVSENPQKALKGKRKVYFKEGWLDTDIYALVSLQPGNRLKGPAIVEGNDTTLVVPKNFMLTVDEYQNMVLEEEDK